LYYLGLDDLILQISSTPLIDKVLTARRPVILTNSVLIENISSLKCDEDLLELYFSNRRKSGISSFKELQILDNGKVIIHLDNKDGKIESNIKQYVLFCLLRHGDTSQSKPFFSGK